MARIARVGDLIEFRTPRGLAYAQITHKVPSYGPLLRVLAGVHTRRPDDVGPLVLGPHRFYVFFPVGAAVSRGIASIVGNLQVPESSKRFPLLRQPGQISPDGRVLNWWVWDGSRRWPIGSPTPEQTRLSIAEVVNDTLLVKRIESDWQPKDAV